MQPSETAAGKAGFNLFTVEGYDLRHGEPMREDRLPMLWRRG